MVSAIIALGVRAVSKPTILCVNSNSYGRGRELLCFLKQIKGRKITRKRVIKPHLYNEMNQTGLNFRVRLASSH